MSDAIQAAITRPEGERYRPETRCVRAVNA
jgi:hypothetical protein